MTGKERVSRAMHLEKPDRVPVYCQLSLGHYMLHTEYKPHQIWFSSETFADALLTLARRYRFDGILVNLPGRCRDWENHIVQVERRKHETRIDWDDGSYSICPDNDNVHHFREDRLPELDEVDPNRLYYIDPHDITGVTYPYYYGFAGDQTQSGSVDKNSFFPEYCTDTLRFLVGKTNGMYHISGEVFSPFSQLMEMFGYETVLLALVDLPEQVTRLLERLSAGAAYWGQLQAGAGADAILVSSAFAGGGFISRDHYRRFVLPFEKVLVGHIHENADVPVYVHTCGSIGDRIDLMIEAGYDGIDTMDPPPLGNTDIARVKEEYGGTIFLKGNIDPVNILLRGNTRNVYAKAVELIENAGYNGGYILSSACSVAPEVDPKNIEMLYRASIDTAG
jgi:uroporphyrinogen-III decarboxylase